MIDLRKQIVSLFSGNIEVEVKPPTPELFPLLREPKVYPKVDPPFTSLDNDQPNPIHQ